MKSLLTIFLTLTLSVCVIAQNSIRGKVTDATGEAIVGSNILLKGTSIGTTTDIDGNYSINAPSDGILVFSYVGYTSQEIAINGQTNIGVTLIASILSFDDLVVIGYGAVKKSNVTGAIISVRQEDLKTVPSTNVMEALQGKLAGVDITRTSGAAGGTVNVLVRGNRSLSASNTPLFIVDGIQYSNIQDINPNDIESMEVLKDAASTAIYGSRGANGVIIITTKKGKAGKTSVTLNTYTGKSQRFGYPKVMDAAQYKAFRREANRAIDKWKTEADDAAIFGNLLQNQGTYWPDLFLKDGSQRDIQLGISTGTEKTSAYISLDYFNENGIVEKDNLNRYSLRANLDHKINNIFSVGTQNQITVYDQDLRYDPFTTANKLIPMENAYDANGNVNILINNGRNISPLTDLTPNNYENNVRTSRLFSAIYANVNILPNLSFKTNLGANITSVKDGLYAASQTSFRNGAQAFARYTAGNSLGLNLENVLNYNLIKGKHNVTLTGVHSVLTNKFESVTAQGTNQLVSNQLYYGLANANSQIAIGADLKESALISYTGRLMYNFSDKYLLTLTARQDGASQLSAENKWAFFPSVAAAWRVSEENFLKNNKIISDLKLRVSYGVAGNSAVEPYSSQSLLTRIPFAWDETAAIGYGFSSRIGNPDLRWETSTTRNFGADFGFINNRVIGSVDVFNTDTKDLLLERLLPLTTGSISIIENVGETNTKGVEIGVTAIPVDRKNFRWTVNTNWSQVQEKIVKLATESNDVANSWFIGQPTQAYYDYEKTGIWQTSEVEEAKKFGQVPGDIKVKDQNGDGKIDATNDRIIVGTNRPSWIGNFSTDIKAYGFDLNVQTFARWGQMIRYGLVGVYDPQANENSLVHNYWTPENPTNDFPRPNASKSQSATLYYSSLFYKNGSFIKLRGVTLGYTLPKHISSKAKLQNARIYVSGRNLWVKSKIENYDPENNGSLANPLNRLFVGGLNLTF
jgi:TonB-linked SusC/RagA family outer membrane protein